MRKLIKYFTTVRKDLLILLVIAFANYILIEFWLNNISEIFSNASKIGQLSSELSIAYISGFIFYFIVVHIKSEKDKENINEWVGYKVHSILTSTHLFFQPFLKTENEKLWFRDWEKSDRSKLLSSIIRNAKDAPYNINETNASWLDWWEYLKDSIFKSFREIYLRDNHVDTKLIRILTRMEHSLFFTQWDILYTNRYDETFGLYQSQIKMYLEHVKDLQAYADKNLSEYKNRTREFMGYKNEY